MKKEDIEFLRELQHELNTQETDGQANPRFWGVLEEREVPTSEDYADETYVYDYEDGASYTVEEYIDVVQTHIEDYVDDEDVIEEWNDLDKSDVGDIVTFCEDSLGWNCCAVYSKTEVFISRETGCFLTKRACQLHIDQNGYNYRKPHTYAMTAWRNPEFERLLRILTTMNIDDIKEDQE